MTPEDPDRQFWENCGWTHAENCPAHIGENHWNCMWFRPDGYLCSMPRTDDLNAIFEALNYFCVGRGLEWCIDPEGITLFWNTENAKTHTQPCLELREKFPGNIIRAVNAAAPLSSP